MKPVKQDSGKYSVFYQLNDEQIFEDFTNKQWTLA